MTGKLYNEMTGTKAAGDNGAGGARQPLIDVTPEAGDAIRCLTNARPWWQRVGNVAALLLLANALGLLWAVALGAVEPRWLWMVGVLPLVGGFLALAGRQ